MVGQNIQQHPRDEDWQILAPTRSELDLMDAAAVESFIKTNRPDVVLHAAGRVGGIEANIQNPVAFLDQNTQIGRNVILGAYKAGVSHLVNLGSTCIYPRHAKNPLSEELILTGELEPTNEGYALAKILALRLCEYIEREDSSVFYKTLVPCNLYGRYDNFDPNTSHLLPAIIHKIHKAKQTGLSEVEIWGDGTARREFMFAADLAEMTLQAVADLSALPGVMNVGLGYDYSINEYYQAVAEVIEWEGEFTHNLSRPVGMKQKLSDVSRLTEWGWVAKTSLIDGIKQSYEFYLEDISF
ncbi:MAG: GDP-L-fucose synthase [Henriciella sp.]